MIKRYFIPAIIAVFALSSCAKEIQDPGIQPESPIVSENVHSLSVGIESGAYVPEDGATKASMEAVIRVKWEQNDSVSVVNATTGKILGGCIKATESGTSVTFEGTVTGTINDGDVLYYVYPRIAQNDSEVAFDQNGYGVSLAGQTYNGDNPGRVSFYGYAQDQASSTSGSISKHIKFNLVTSYVHLNMANLPAAGFNLSSIDISKVNKGFKWSLSDSKELTASAYGENEGISVNCSNCKITQAGNAVARFAIPASAATGSDSRVVTVNKAYTNDKYVTDQLKPSAYYNQLYTSWESNVKVTSESGKTKVSITTSEGSTEVAEGVIPVAEAFVATQETEIGIGGVGTITFDQTASEKIKSNAESEGSTSVFFKVEDVTDTDDVEKKNIVYEVTMKTVDEKGVEVFADGKAAGVATVTVPLGEEVKKVESVKLLNENGEPIEGGVVDNSIKFEAGILTFKVNHFSKYAIQYTVNEDATYVAQIGNSKYTTLANAIAAVQNGNTIVMLHNDVLTKGLTITLENNEAFTLDLNGKTVSIAETGFDFTANGTNSALRNGVPARFAIVVNGVGSMTICDNSTGESGRLETKNNSYGTTKTILVDGNAIVNVNSGTIAADYAPFYVVGYTATGAVPVDAPKPTLNVNGGKIVGQEVGIGIKGNTATLKVLGGEIVGDNQMAISTNGTQDWYDGGKFAIEITGGLIKSASGAAMYLPAEGPTVITGGTFEGGVSGIAVKGGTLSISGNAVVKATGTKKEDAHAAESGYSETGSCIYVEDTYSGHAPIVNISGGKFSSENNKAVEYFTNKADDASDKGKVTLTGGVYSNDPDASLVAEGYAVVANTDAATKDKYPYTVKFHPVVKIGDVEYADIAAAFAAVPTDGTSTTVTLLDNIGSKEDDVITWKEYAKTSVYKIDNGQNITFDLKGHKIYAKTTVEGYTCFFEVVNGGSLTFMDSVGGGELNYLDGKDNTGGLAIISYGKLVMQSGTVENHTKCNSSAIQGAIDVRANEWGAQYQYHSVFTMNGGVLKSNGDNTLRIYDSSQTGTGSVVVDFTINGGEVYGADAIFIQPAWTKTYSANGIYMNNFKISVTGGKFDTNNGIRVYGAVNETNNQTYRAIQISVTGGEFTIRKPSAKYRYGHIAYQNNGTSTEDATEFLRSYTEVNWSANSPTYCQE